MSIGGDFWLRLLTTGAFILAAAPAAGATTLRDALAEAYRSNPSITGARASLRALDEGVPQAKALGRPIVGVSAGVTHNYNDQPTSDNHTTDVGVGASVSLPLFQGGLVGSSVRAAESRIVSGRENLRSTEAQTFVDVVSAYMDVISARSVVDLNINQVKVLETNLQASQDRFDVGDLTRTDVAQSEARLASVRSALISAQGQLTIAKENYLRIVGQPPIDLQPPPSLPSLPDDADAAVEIALAGNPSLASVKADEQAAAYDVRSARSAQLPTLSATASGNYSDYLGSYSLPRTYAGLASARQTQTSGQIGLTANIPLYQGGLVASRVREARARQSQAMEQTVLVERSIVNQTRGAYVTLLTARAVKRSSETAVNANELALEGVKAENSVGTRDVLDVLNAEQELLNSRVTLVTAERDEYVAGFALLAAMGAAEARDLGLEGGALYDPRVNYRRVRNTWSDWAIGEQPVRQATSTTAKPAQ